MDEDEDEEPSRGARINVVTATQRRVVKRAPVPITDIKLVTAPILEPRTRFQDAGLPRGFGGKENVVLIDYGDQFQLGGISQQDALDQIGRFAESDALTKAYVDRLIARVEGVEHTFIPPLP